MDEVVREVDVVVCLIRLSMALLCGGILGMERGRKKRPAGFRTYMLVCLGSALVMMTNEYINYEFGAVDVSRMGAQVINGIGFLGAGTIIFTGHNKVKGLTTAAGLWASACIGLAIGIGFYSGAIIGTIMIYIVIALLHNVDERVMSSTKVMNLYLETDKTTDISNLIAYAKENDMKVSDLELERTSTNNEERTAVLLTLRLSKNQPHAQIINNISLVSGIRYVEEI